MLRSRVIAMRKFVVMIAVLVASSSPAWAAPVRHAGEWQTIIDNGQPFIACLPSDATLDQDYITRLMAKIPGADCKVSNANFSGSVISYSLQCTVNGSLMTSSGTVTQTGPDEFTTKAHSHGGSMKMPNGQTMAFPDSDMVTVQRRLGACKPGDRQINH
jgi:hypothetical protein